MEEIYKDKKEIEPIIGLINDFEDFFVKIEKRKEQLEELKENIMIYEDVEFMKSIKRADEDVKKGRIKICGNSSDRKKLFESL